MPSIRFTKPVAALAIAAASLAPLAGTPAPAAAAGSAECATANHPGGDWPSYGQNLSNTRAQDKEKKIDASNVGNLAAAWTFTADIDGGETGAFQSTPVIAEGCVYMTNGSGFIYALNADTGELVWKGRYEKTVEGVCCGATLFAPTVKDGVLYEYVSRNPDTAGDGKGPYALAIDAHTGKVIWRSKSVDTEPGAYTNSSAVLYKGLLLMGISGPEGGNQNIGGYAILDAKTGRIIKRVHTVPTNLVEDGWGGGTIWSTAVVDSAGYAYAGTGQPTNPNREYHLTNSIVKIDLNRDHKTFGEIVDSYKGTPDSRTYNSPACQSGPPEAGTATCTYTDVDFGASPTLLRDSIGRPMVVETQKSGDLHGVYTDGMVGAWIAKVAPAGHALGTYASTSTDGTSVFAAGNYPGQVFSVSDVGFYNWVAPAPTSFGANPTTYANGIVYHADAKGILNAFDAATGAPLFERPMQSDTGGPCLNTGGGVAVARNIVYAVCGERGFTFFGPSDAETGWLVAYRLP
jgi:outer membrane protein assembly factor BamB